MKPLLLVLSLQISSAMATEQILTCEGTRPDVTITVQFEENSGESLFAHFEYESIYRGTFPTVDRAHGGTSGSVMQTSEGIEARFDFIAFDVASHLEVAQSVGKVVIGRGVEGNLACTLRPVDPSEAQEN